MTEAFARHGVQKDGVMQGLIEFEYPHSAQASCRIRRLSRALTSCVHVFVRFELWEIEECLLFLHLAMYLPGEVRQEICLFLEFLVPNLDRLSRAVGQ